MKIFRTLLTLVFLLLLSKNAYATHIVGGELELQYISGNDYRLNLVVYFDEINGQAGAIDADARIDFFTKSNSFVQSFTIPLVSQTRVNYTQLACTIGFLSTRRLLYSQVITLSPSVFTSSLGYYLTYERCCRNNIIENIVNPQNAGQTFYLEIPPLLKNGQRFINSSPTLFPPLSDYACVGVPFYFDFGGEDVDGDSLVYSLSVPLNGNSSPQDPRPTTPLPGPFSTITFWQEYDLNNMILGNPPLRIDSKSGFITITPSRNGLFVFAIKCEEYRNGEKIGELRRDYQMLVLNCPPIAPPIINSVTDKDGVIINDQNPIELEIGAENECFEVKVTDPNPNTFINPRIIPIQPQEDYLSLNGNFNVAINPGQIKSFQVCLDKCKIPTDSLYKFLLLVGDNSCALPLYDTIALSIKIKDTNLAPEVNTSLSYNSSEDYYEGEIVVGETLSFDIEGLDSDNDIIELAALAEDNILDLLGIPTFIKKGTPPLKSTISITPTCELLTQPTFEAKDYYINLIVKDFNDCDVLQKQKEIRVKLRIKPSIEENTKPQINPTILNVFDRNTFSDTLTVGETLIFDLVGSDFDNDLIALSGLGLEFDIQTLTGLDFASASGIGSVTSRFAWTPDCSHLGENFTPKLYPFLFYVQDQRSCTNALNDSLFINLLVVDKPQIPLEPFPNAFTPNGDGIGDEFNIQNLPLDNCADQFISISIVNRWGEEVYYSPYRNFTWKAEGFPSGIYFYYVRYLRNTYKGTINLINGN
jgi:gliding motility-associated-like protein